MDPRSLSRRRPCRDGRGGYRGAWSWALLAAVSLFLTSGPAVKADRGAPPNGGTAPFEGTPPGEGATGGRMPPQLRAGTNSNRFCVPEEGVPLIELGEVGMDSLGRRMTAANDAAWERTDSLFRAGVFGDPGSEDARAKTLTHFKLRTRMALDYLADLCSDPFAHGVTEHGLARPFGVWYANTTVFPIRFLEQGTVGAGGFCLRYRLPDSFDEPVMLGGVPVRIHRDQVKEDDALDPKAALSVQFSSELHSTIELLFLTEVCGQARRETIVDRGDTLELITVTEIEGMYARRGGTHRLGALVYWRSVTAGDRDPDRPRAGAYAYFPRISLSLPFFLPDIGLDDLREFDLPNPVVSMDWVRAHPSKPWVRVSPDAFFIPWKAMGPVPEEVERRFPDL
jgi:hypothetical protein